MPSTLWAYTAEALVVAGNGLGPKPEPRAYSAWKANVHNRVLLHFPGTPIQPSDEVRDIDEHFWQGETTPPEPFPNLEKGRDVVVLRLEWSAGIRRFNGQSAGYPLG